MKREDKRGRRIAIVGLDGSGKSANIANLKTDPRYERYCFVWVRWKPCLLRPAYWLLNRQVKREAEGEKGLGERRQLSREYQKKAGLKARLFANPLFRGIWMCLALSDYIIQFYGKTAGLLLKGRDMIFDRSYLDFFVDQGISFGYSPEKVERALGRFQFLFPKMDQIIYLRVSPKTCYRRKEDIPNMEYLLKRYVIYERLSRLPEWVQVDGERPFKQVNEEIRRRLE